jgi:uncharacterized protein
LILLDANVLLYAYDPGLLVEAQVSGPLVMDAFLAALALENGATLVTTDRDFSRFPKLRLSDPTSA